MDYDVFDISLSCRMLFSDYEKHVCRLAQNTLEAVGCQVFTVPDNGAALEYLRHNRVDVAFIDVITPRMDGFELLDCLLEETLLPLYRVVMMTARRNDIVPDLCPFLHYRGVHFENLQAVQQNGGSFAGFDWFPSGVYLLKPFNPRGLVEAVAHCLRNPLNL